MANSVGSLYIDIQARTAQMETDLEKVKQKVSSMGSFANASNLSFQGLSKTLLAGMGASTLAAAGLVAAFVGVGLAINDVRGRIMDIPGVPQDVISSVNKLNYSAYETGLSWDHLKAKVAGFAGDFSRALQYAWTDFDKGPEAAAAAMAKFDANAQAFATRQYDTQMAAYQEQINALNTETAAENKLKDIRGQKVDYLLEEAALLRAIAAGETAATIPAEANLAGHPKVQQLLKNYDVQGGMSEKDKQDANLAAQAATLTADTALQREYKTSTAAMQKYEDELQKVQQSHQSLNEQLDYWNLQLQHGTEEMEKGAALEESGELGKGYQMVADGYTKMAKATAQVANLQQQIWGQFSQDLAQDFGDAISQGETFNTLLHKIGATIEQELIKRLITQPLAQELFGLLSGAGSWFSGTGSSGADTFSLASIDMAGHAMGGPVNAPTMVGELGPELFVPPSGGGTIIPNNQLRSSGGDGINLHVTYQIQSGVTRNELAPILEQNNRRLKGDIANTIKRGGARASQFAKA